MEGRDVLGVIAQLGVRLAGFTGSSSSPQASPRPDPWDPSEPTHGQRAPPLDHPWAERAASTSWHPGHIAERYGLFTIIVLGESVMAASLAIQAVTWAEQSTGELAGIIVGGMLILFSMWWLYFDRPVHQLTSLRVAFVWGYSHLPIFASGAAVGAGLAVATEHATGSTEIGAFGAGAAVAVPVAIFLLVLWALHRYLEPEGPARSFLSPAVALLVVLTPATGKAVLATGLLLAGLLATKLIRRQSTG